MLDALNHVSTWKLCDVQTYLGQNIATPLPMDLKQQLNSIEFLNYSFLCMQLWPDP